MEYLFYPALVSLLCLLVFLFCFIIYATNNNIASCFRFIESEFGVDISLSDDETTVNVVYTTNKGLTWFFIQGAVVDGDHLIWGNISYDYNSQIGYQDILERFRSIERIKEFEENQKEFYQKEYNRIERRKVAEERYMQDSRFSDKIN